MECRKRILVSRLSWLLLLLLTTLADAIRVNPCRNKIAPYSAPEPKTFGLLFGPNRPLSAAELSSGVGPSGCSPATSTSHPDDNASLVAVDGDNNGGNNPDYLDPVHSEEQTEYQNDRPVLKPDRPLFGAGGGGGGFWSGNAIGGGGSGGNWWSNIVTPDRWPTRPPHLQHRPPASSPLFEPASPHRPPRPPGGGGHSQNFWPQASSSNWFWNWIQSVQNRPQKPNRPPPYGDVKPVHESIEGDAPGPSATWRPGPLVGGPSNSIVGLAQDISSWNRPPTPRPTRPSIPGYADYPTRPRGDNEQQQGIFGSFVDLLFNRRRK